MADRKRYPIQNDFVAILGRNTDGWLQVKFVRRVLSMTEKIQFFANRVLAQMVHDRTDWNIGCHSRQDSDWFAAERVLFSEYDPNDILNVTVKCLLFKACWILSQKDPDFPDLNRFIVKSDNGSYIVGYKFAYFLEELSSNRARVWHIISAACDESCEITYDDVERCLWAELEDLFRQKEKEGYKWHSE